MKLNSTTSFVIRLTTYYKLDNEELHIETFALKHVMQLMLD